MMEHIWPTPAPHHKHQPVLPVDGTAHSASIPSPPRVPTWPSNLHFSHSSLRSSADPDDPIAHTPPLPPLSNMREVHPVHLGHFSAPQASPGCAECLTDCQEPSCATIEMTAQCTDQCVVVACHDPDHGDLNCHGERVNLRCDVACEGSKDCSDCAGLEDFLECCTDYHSYFSDPRGLSGEMPSSSSSSPDPDWEASLDAFLCECGAMEQPTPATNGKRSQPTDHGINYQPHTDFLSPSFQSQVYSSQLPIPHFQPQSHDSPTEPLQQLPSLKCMWDNCQAQFPTLSDLVGHVNLQHLRVPAVQQPQENTLSSMSCLWGNCTVYPSGTTDAALDVLSSHLLQDHLGVLTPSFSTSSSWGCNTPALENMSSIITSSSSGPVSDYQPSFGVSMLSIPTPTSSVPSISQNPPSPSSSAPTSSVTSFTSPASPSNATVTHVCLWRSCSATFTSISDLTTHITSTHIGSGKAHYECFWEECTRNGEGGRFASKQKICRHVQTHTGHRPFKCKVCKQNFSEAATLQQHMRRHTQERPYACDFPGCGKSFAITGALTIHKRTHNGLKPFKCTYCDRAFSESSNLSKHLRTHTGARPYICTEGGCGKSFARPDQLARHMGVHRRTVTGPNDTKKMQVELSVN